MEKEVTSPTTKQLPSSKIPESNTESKPTSKPISYKYIGKDPQGQSIKSSVPKILIPTKRMITIVGIIFLLVIIIAAVQFPYAKLLRGNLDIEIKIGYPFTFIDLGIEITERPFRSMNFILDLIIYILLSYIIDIFLSFILGAHTTRIRQQEETGPKIYKPTQPGITEKVTKKVFKEQEPTLQKKTTS